MQNNFFVYNPCFLAYIFPDVFDKFVFIKIQNVHGLSKFCARKDLDGSVLGLLRKNPVSEPESCD